MIFQVRYHNKPHDLRLRSIHICELARGIWWVTCGLNLRGYEIAWHGGEPGRNTSVFFGDDDKKKQVRAELILYARTKEEGKLSLMVDGIQKRTYHAILVSSKRLSSAWKKFEAARYLKITRRRRKGD